MTFQNLNMPPPLLSQSRGLGKVGRHGAIRRFQKELSWRLGTLHNFLGIKLFCLSKAENFSI
jgi:hypothetical protein